MDLMQSVKTVLANYANFNGRSGRSEYWWWVLSYVIAYCLVYIIGGIVGAADLLAALFGLALLVPNIAVSVRRFHDIGMSGWWCLVFFIPIAGLVAWVYFFTKASDGPNQFGESALVAAA